MWGPTAGLPRARLQEVIEQQPECAQVLNSLGRSALAGVLRTLVPSRGCSQDDSAARTGIRARAPVVDSAAAA